MPRPFWLEFQYTPAAIDNSQSTFRTFSGPTMYDSS
jgi:hypothetical protein